PFFIGRYIIGMDIQHVIFNMGSHQLLSVLNKFSQISVARPTQLHLISSALWVAVHQSRV
ncbi:MAG: hypothetical protein AAGF66_01315, partial [Cyanobacteria bacterium P01_H01_bin.119]